MIPTDDAVWTADDLLLPGIQEPDASETGEAEEERLRVILVGSRQAVTTAIHELSNRGFASTHVWSALTEARKPGEVLSVLSRRVYYRGDGLMLF